MENRKAHKAVAWDTIGELYWNAGYMGGPDPHGIEQYLEGVDRALNVAIIGASTRHLVAAAPMLADAADNSETVAQLCAGDEIRMLDNSRGWAWGYGPNGRVGYIRAEAVGI